MNRAIRGLGYGLGGLVGLVALALAAVYGVSEARMRKTYDVQPAAVAIRSDAALIERGRHVATIRGCVDCHGEGLVGRMFIDAAPVAKLYSSNLTRGAGGVGATYTDRDWVRAIRHGIGPDGKPLIFMPSQEFYPLSDEDLGALIAYLKALPAMDHILAESTIGPLGRALFLAGQLPLLPAEIIDHDAARDAAPTPGPTAEYGAYLATGCTGCHGTGFSGGRIPGTPPEFPAAANLTPHETTGIGTWTEADFFRALRRGRRPDGRELAPEMPWKLTAQMTDDEIRALWLYLRTVPAREYGNH